MASSRPVTNANHRNPTGPRPKHLPGGPLDAPPRAGCLPGPAENEDEGAMRQWTDGGRRSSSRSLAPRPRAGPGAWLRARLRVVFAGFFLDVVSVARRIPCPPQQPCLFWCFRTATRKTSSHAPRLGGGECARLSKDQFVSTQETRERIESEISPLQDIAQENPWDECRNYQLPEAHGVVGFISPVSQPFCGTCNRMRLTADGKFHLCLLKDNHLDLRKTLREGGTARDIQDILLRAVRLKPVGHELGRGVSGEKRSMYQIGG